MIVTEGSPRPVSLTRIFRSWWPLAASWLLMAVETPVLSAVVARLTQPELNLAAWGGIVFPISLLVEAPVIMLLAASTALSKDYQSYRLLRKIMMIMGVFFSSLHALIAFTPLYDVIVGNLLGVPPEIREPGRIGLQLMLPWTYSIAYRRFNQGILIRFDHTRAIGIGTVIRLSGEALVLFIGYRLGTIPGIVIAGCTISVGVISEAIYTAFRVRPVVRDQVRYAPTIQPALTLRAFLDFYIPLALTSLITLIIQPIGSAALSRMPSALLSLAVWPVLAGLVFMTRSLGIALNEVVVALLDEANAVAALRRFTIIIAISTTLLLFIFQMTPAANIWFATISGLTPALAALARQALWFALPMPLLAVYQSFYQGIILHSRRTRGITEAVVLFLAVTGGLLWAGVAWGQMAGAVVGWFAFSMGSFAQTLWLWFRHQPGRRALEVDHGTRTAI